MRETLINMKKGHTVKNLAPAALVATLLATVAGQAMAQTSTSSYYPSVIRVQPQTALDTTDDTTALMTEGLALGLFATLSSPAFSNDPTAPTAASGTSTTQIATTGFVASYFAAITGAAFQGPVAFGSGTATTANSLTLSGAAAGSTPTITASGSSDTVVNMIFKTQNAGNITVANTGNTNQLSFNTGGTSPSIKANSKSGTGDVPLYLGGQGNGTIYLQVPSGTPVIEAVNNPGEPTGSTTGTSGLQVTSGASGAVTLTVTDTANTNSDLSLTARGSGAVRVPTASYGTIDTTAASTQFVRGNALSCVPPIAGNGYTPPWASSTTSTAYQGNTNINFQPIRFCGTPPVMKGFFFEVTTAPTTATHIRFGLYPDNGLGTGPKTGTTPVADSGDVTVPLTNIGIQIVTLTTPATIPGPGLYWVAAQGNGTPYTMALRSISTGGTGGTMEIMGFSPVAGNTMTADVNTTLFQTGLSYGPMPSLSALPADSNNIMPIVGVLF